MIEPPRRSVTRFFIPLIDVLILLFCIFLLMPYVKPVEGDVGDATGKGTIAEPPAEPLPNDVAELRREVERLRADREQLLRDRDTVLKRLAIRVLEIDRSDGRLYYYDPERVEVATQADAQGLIDAELRRTGSRELYLLILYPREPSGFPLQKQVLAYEKWFADVPHGFDSPGGR
ncbi:MAG TPA: hypothetical protein VL371_17750 [Gemmataceae bacterium]|nr:hypothetical protein [Gemmataceae bacterium]